MTRFASLFLAITLLACMSAKAQSQYFTTLRSTLNDYAGVLNSQCPRIAGQIDAMNGDDEAKVLMMKQTQQLICGCQPQKMAAYRATLTEEQLGEPTDETQFMSVMRKHVIGPCSRILMLDLLSGATCERLSTLKADKVKEGFCGCTKAPLEQFSDEDAITFGLDAADYIPALARARREGTPDPARTPTLDRLFGVIGKCGGGDFLAR